MVDAVTNNVALIIPATGADVGAWGTSVINVNMQALDGIVGGFATISLSVATTIALSLPAGSLTPGAGPNQSENCLIKLSGTLTGNAILQLGMPREYMFDNRCTVGAFYVQVAPATGTGTAVGLPPGQKVKVHYDGTNVDYVDTLPVGAALDLHGFTALPAWMSACSTSPFLIKDGSIYTVSIYPQLGAILGSTFGGNGITTFGVPDERARARIGYDNIPAASNATAARLTGAVAGFAGNVMGTSGGDQNPQQHTHTSAGHNHPTTSGTAYAGTTFVGSVLFSGGGASTPISLPTNLLNATTGMGTAVIASSGSGAAGNVPPSIVSFLPLIKTG